jgi:hypothetical protein
LSCPAYVDTEQDKKQEKLLSVQYLLAGKSQEFENRSWRGSFNQTSVGKFDRCCGRTLSDGCKKNFGEKLLIGVIEKRSKCEAIMLLLWD